MTTEGKEAIGQALEEGLELYRRFASALVAQEQSLMKLLERFEDPEDQTLTQKLRHACYTFVVTANNVKDSVATAQQLTKQEAAKLK